MLRGVSRYRQNLDAGLQAYRDAAGRAPEPERLDVARREVRRLYDTFRRRRLRSHLGPTDGERIQLELGLKRVLRERVDAQHLPALEQRARDDGHAFLAVPLPAPARPAALDGIATAPLADFHVYVGPDPSDLDEAAALDQRMVPHQVIPEDGPHLDGPSDEDTRRLGELLGYPLCCRRWYAGHADSPSNREPIDDAARRSEGFSPLLNNLSLGAFHHAAWQPCSYGCVSSLETVRAIDAELARRHPVARKALLPFLRMPRLYLDERRQLILDGAPDDDGFRYHDALSPYALDQARSAAAFEWVWFVDVVARVQEGDRLRPLGDGAWEVLRGRQRLHRLELPGAVALPFGA